MIKVEFYGVNGYCTICHQPLEGRGCPYCGWEDENPPQFGYVKDEGDALRAENSKLKDKLERAKELAKSMAYEGYTGIADLLLRTLEE